LAVLIGVLVAASFGSGDFLGGVASRRARTISVLAWSQVVALAGAAIVAVAGGGRITAHDVALGAGAGVLNVIALGCLYRALAIGQNGQVAPLAAVIGAILPVTWGIAHGERPSTAALVGICMAVVAAALVSGERTERRGPLFTRSLALAVAAGLGFGTSLILFASTSHHSGFWPVLTARAASVVAVAVVLQASGRSLSMAAVTRRQAILAGVLDVGATTLLLIALRRGLTATVAPVAALAPGFTVVHAWWFLHERATPLQFVGLTLALVGLPLIALG
jgi:uncharacterized membrane protein